MCNIFENRNINYTLRSQTDFMRTNVNASNFGINSLKCLVTKLWDFVLYDIKSIENLPNYLTLIWVGFLGVRFEVGVGQGVKLPPCLKLVRIMLES